MSIKDPEPEFIVVTDDLPYTFISDYCVHLLDTIQSFLNDQKNPDEYYFTHLFAGYSEAIADTFCLRKKDGYEYFTAEVKRQTDLILDKCRYIQKEHKYDRAVEYVRGSVKDAEPLISAASKDDLISLYDIGLHSLDCTGEDFYDLYDDLLKKYSIVEKKAEEL